MKRYISFFIIALFLSLSFFSFKPQENKISKSLAATLENSDSENFTVWIYFKDKGPSALSKLNSPLDIVSQRSLNRRSKVKPAGGLLDYTDIPVYSEYVNTLSSSVLKIRHRIKWLNTISAEVNRQQIERISRFDFVEKIELVERFKLSAG